jgi:hypothetical protein
LRIIRTGCYFRNTFLKIELSIRTRRYRVPFVKWTPQCAKFLTLPLKCSSQSLYLNLATLGLPLFAAWHVLQRTGSYRFFARLLALSMNHEDGTFDVRNFGASEKCNLLGFCKLHLRDSMDTVPIIFLLELYRIRI